ncbi:MAG: hypothetical protein KIT60_16405 [Burkholderiaceae bacterium]|nr:hypothetical protein [Burkholderiaceae bacterium]
MVHIPLLAALLCACAAAHAQDPVHTDGGKYQQLLDNPCVRVLEYRDLPGDRTHPHRHPAFVLYALSTFKRRLHLPDGHVLAREFKAGDVMWSPAQTHVGENVGDTPTHVLIVETKPNAGTNPACSAP